MLEGFVVEKRVLKKYEGPGGEAVIPEGVEEIGFQAFKGQAGVTSVKFPKGLKRLRKEAFAGCTGLMRIELPEGVQETGMYAFMGCSSLRSVSLPEGLDRIADCAFKDCSALEEINFPGSLKTVGRGAFRDCGLLPSPTLPEGLEEIGWYAFAGCRSMEALTIPASVRWIEEGIVSHSGIKRLTLLGEPETLNRKAFAGYDGELTSLRTPIGKFGPDDKRKVLRGLVKVWNTGELDPEIKSGCLKYIQLRRKDLYETAIKDETLLIVMIKEKVIPPKHLQDLLTRCTETGNHEASALLLEYGKDFPPADPVKEVEKGFKAIEREAKAAKTYQQTGILTIALTKKEWIYGRDGEDGLALKSWKGEGTELTTPKGIGRKPVTKIGENAFFKGALTRAVITEGAKTIGAGAFWNCGKLASVTLPGTLTEIGNAAFRGCTALTSIELPEGLTRIRAQVFLGCTGLTSVRIPESVTDIGWLAFGNCKNLEQVWIPATVTEISLAAFVDCPRLTIRAPAGSYAETFAKENGIPFKAC